MKYPAEQKAETHEKILNAAARSFRQHGADANGIGRVMKGLGMTKGGFYRHFKSKDDLYAAAVERAFEETGNYAAAAAEAAPKGQEMRAIIENYLSAEHLNHPEAGCPLAFMASEFGRQPAAVRRRINRALLAFAERILPYIPGADTEEKRRKVLLLSSGIAGTLALARTIVEPQRREDMLAAARLFYVNAFVSKGKS